MESALKGILQRSFGEYVSGFDRMDASSFPLTLRDLQLKEKKIQEELDEDGSFPFDLNTGRIGSITVKPGWMGSVEICATNVVLNLTFSPKKALMNSMRKEDPGDPHSPVQRDLPPMQPPAPVPPRYCPNHDSSEKRPKTEPRFQECQVCQQRIQTNYADFSLCPPCSESTKRCMICGANAPHAGNYVPANTVEAANNAGRGINGPNGGCGNCPPPPPPRPDTGRGRESFRGPREAERGPPCGADRGMHTVPEDQYGNYGTDLPPPSPYDNSSSDMRDPRSGMYSGRDPKGPRGGDQRSPFPGPGPCQGEAASSSGSCNYGAGSPNSPGAYGGSPLVYDAPPGRNQQQWGQPPHGGELGPRGYGHGPQDDGFLGFLRRIDFGGWASCVTNTGHHPRSGIEYQEHTVGGKGPQSQAWRGGA